MKTIKCLGTKTKASLGCIRVESGGLSSQARKKECVEARNSRRAVAPCIKDIISQRGWGNCLMVNKSMGFGMGLWAQYGPI